MKRFTMLLGALALCSTAPFAQDLTLAQREEVTAIFSDLDRPSTPGASVAVIRGGDIVYSEGFGSAQLEHGAPVTPNTIFHVASVSKQFTAMAVLLLEGDGALSLDDDVRAHVPYVPDMGAAITPRHLLHHTSGVRDQWELLAMAGWRLDDVITKEHIRRLMSKQRELNFEPGAEHLYSNMGYSVAADLVEHVSGMPFSEFVRTRIFEPLGMDRSHVHDDHQMVVPDRAYSYRQAGWGFRNAVLSYANHGATSLFTTAEDLVIWLDNFRVGTVGGPKVLKAMTMRGVLTTGDPVAYALGVVMDVYRGATLLQHGGADAGFRSQVAWFPEHETGIAVLSNLASGNPGARVRRVADVVLGAVLDPAPEAAEQREPDQATAERPGLALSVELLSRYEGPFRTPMFNMQLDVREGALWLTSPEEERLVASERLEGARILVAEQPNLAELTGTYYSPEIETLYEVRKRESGLGVYHLRFGEVPLTMTGENDRFVGGPFFMQDLRFTRDDTGRVDGFRLSGARVRDLRFVRLAEGLPR